MYAKAHVHRGRATPKGCAALHYGTATDGRVSVTLRNDAPLAHPFSHAFEHA